MFSTRSSGIPISMACSFARHTKRCMVTGDMPNRKRVPQSHALHWDSHTAQLVFILMNMSVCVYVESHWSQSTKSHIDNKMPIDTQARQRHECEWARPTLRPSKREQSGSVARRLCDKIELCRINKDRVKCVFCHTLWRNVVLMFQRFRNAAASHGYPAPNECLTNMNWRSHIRFDLLVVDFECLAVLEHSIVYCCCSECIVVVFIAAAVVVVVAFFFS